MDSSHISYAFLRELSLLMHLQKPRVDVNGPLRLPRLEEECSI